ncbi:uncharacterized protein GGS22DRAFT_185243 [Annulohypoxylon maeteangense]|uniref:uncharacterized protein n=1 Tax=Annulohypoxylon maeteangense TaxID=1927788 RepID=UPI002007B8FE|nr:uncharacterized protein GGS22DRAFT_185243 [Annulohypoxylon maeteangense]KAI0887863.1 hypothetical protein GGS22DRAFT_185243 [Annulohypoxylon maeteangense]
MSSTTSTSSSYGGYSPSTSSSYSPSLSGSSESLISNWDVSSESQSDSPSDASFGYSPSVISSHSASGSSESYSSSSSSSSGSGHSTPQAEYNTRARMSAAPLTEEQVGGNQGLIPNHEQQQGGLNNVAAPAQETHAVQSVSADHNDNDAEDAPEAPEAPEHNVPQNNAVLQCAQCHKIFKNRATYRQHLADVHIGTRCYWPGCAQVFANERELNAHLRDHNDTACGCDPVCKITCHFPSCGKVCTMAESVGRHLRRHNIEARNASHL